MKNNKLEDLANFAKSLKEEKPVISNSQVRIPVQNPKRYANPLVKSAGRGGVQFNFGHLTGCALADNATAILNRHADPIQAETVRQQRQDINKAFGDYIEVGEDQWQNRMVMRDGSPMEQWTKQLGSSTDNTIKSLYEKGELDCSEVGMPSVGPAIRNVYNKSEITMGSEVIKATSETDAELIKLMNSQGLDESNGHSEECID